HHPACPLRPNACLSNVRQSSGCWSGVCRLVCWWWSCWSSGLVCVPPGRGTGLSCRAGGTGWWFVEDEDVFVGDEVGGVAVGAGGAGFVGLEERGAGDQVSVADGGQQRDAALEGLVAGGGGGVQDRGGEVGEQAVVPPRPCGDREDAAGAEQRVAGGEDVGEPAEQGLEGLVGEVCRVVGVGAVPFWGR